MRQIEDFNICSSAADHSLFFDSDFREAVEMSINYMCEKYEYQSGADLDSSKLILFLYPDSEDCRIEIKDSRQNPMIILSDCIKPWLQILAVQI